MLMGNIYPKAKNLKKMDSQTVVPLDIKDNLKRWFLNINVVDNPEGRFHGTQLLNGTGNYYKS